MANPSTIKSVVEFIKEHDKHFEAQMLDIAKHIEAQPKNAMLIKNVY